MTNSSTKPYQVVSPDQETPWATFNSYIEASNHIKALGEQMGGIHFNVKGPKSDYSDEALQAEFDFLN